jgi:sugar (pentulose or hexulose) kinase
LTTREHGSLYLGIDVGTTATKAILVDATGAAHGRGHAGYQLECPRPGQYVQDATDWQDGVNTAVRSACAHVDPSRVVALAISAQGGTLVAVDEHHRPLAPARSWLDRRATRSAATFERVFGPEDFYRRTGWPIAPNNTAAQLLDLASADPETFAAAICFCDTSAYLNGWLIGTPTIDANVAGIAQLIDARAATWDEDILEVIGVTPARLPRIAAPGSAIGSLTQPAATALGLCAGTVVAAGAHDQYCAALGVGAIGEGDILLSTGTAWVMLAAACEAFGDPAASIGSGRHLVPGLWGHFGEVSNGGVSIEWARRVLNHGDNAPLSLSDLDAILGETARGAEGLSFFPFFDGTSPYDTLETSRGSLLGLRLSHDHRHVLRAVAEGVTFAMRILLDRYRSSVAGTADSSPVVVGGATRSREWMQLLADVLDANLLVGAEPDAACIGAAILAAIAAGDMRDVRAGAARMVGRRTVAAADGDASRVYEHLLSIYKEQARALGELYAARPHTSPEGKPA